MRTDLPIGVIAAQIAHAAGESSPGDLKEGTHAIVLGVPSEEALRAALASATLRGMRATPINEPDAPYCGQLMSIGFAPVPRSVGRRALSSLPLFRGSTHAGVAKSTAPEREVLVRDQPPAQCVRSSSAEHPA